MPAQGTDINTPSEGFLREVRGLILTLCYLGRNITEVQLLSACGTDLIFSAGLCFEQFFSVAFIYVCIHTYKYVYVCVSVCTYLNVSI